MRTSPASPFWATSHRDQAQTPYSLISGWPFLHLEENDLSFPKGAPSRLEGLAPESAQLMLGARRGSSGVKTDSGRKWKKSGRPHQLDQEATLEPHTEHQVWSCSVFQRTPRQREEKKFKVKVRGAGGAGIYTYKRTPKDSLQPRKTSDIRQKPPKFPCCTTVGQKEAEPQTGHGPVGARGFLGWECSTVCCVPMDPRTWSRWEVSKGKTPPMCLGRVRWT